MTWKHQLWLWVWFYLGMGTYWFKRAYYGINPPNPIANGYWHWLQRSAAPLAIRMFLETLFYWIFFIPGMADKAFAALGWQTYGWAIGLVTQFAPFAAFFGHTIDSVADMAVSKIPVINKLLVQMPGPLPPTPVTPPAPPQQPPATPPANH